MFCLGFGHQLGLQAQGKKKTLKPPKFFWAPKLSFFSDNFGIGRVVFRISIIYEQPQQLLELMSLFLTSTLNVVIFYFIFANKNVVVLTSQRLGIGTMWFPKLMSLFLTSTLELFFQSCRPKVQNAFDALFISFSFLKIKWTITIVIRNLLKKS